MKVKLLSLQEGVLRKIQILGENIKLHLNFFASKLLLFLFIIYHFTAICLFSHVKLILLIISF